MPIIANQRLSVVLANKLQERIIEQGLEEGAILPTEPEIMKEYGVSRTVVREAAVLLVSRGLVEVRPRRGMTVRMPDGKGLSESLTAQLRMSQVSLPQLLEVRLALECAIARIAALNRTDEDLQKLKRNLEEFGVPELTRAQTVELDMEFHNLLSIATHNPFFQLVTKPINELLHELYIDKTGYLILREHTCQEHRRILTAVEDRDSASADEATRVHLQRVGQTVEILLAGVAPQTETMA